MHHPPWNFLRRSISSSRNLVQHPHRPIPDLALAWQSGKSTSSPNQNASFLQDRLTTSRRGIRQAALRWPNCSKLSEGGDIKKAGRTPVLKTIFCRGAKTLSCTFSQATSAQASSDKQAQVRRSSPSRQATARQAGTPIINGVQSRLPSLFFLFASFVFVSSGHFSLVKGIKDTSPLDCCSLIGGTKCFLSTVRRGLQGLGLARRRRDFLKLAAEAGTRDSAGRQLGELRLASCSLVSLSQEVL